MKNNKTSDQFETLENNEDFNEDTNNTDEKDLLIKSLKEKIDEQKQLLKENNIIKDNASLHNFFNQEVSKSILEERKDLYSEGVTPIKWQNVYSQIHGDGTSFSLNSVKLYFGPRVLYVDWLFIYLIEKGEYDIDEIKQKFKEHKNNENIVTKSKNIIEFFYKHFLNKDVREKLIKDYTGTTFVPVKAEKYFFDKLNGNPIALSEYNIKTVAEQAFSHTKDTSTTGFTIDIDAHLNNVDAATIDSWLKKRF